MPSIIEKVAQQEPINTSDNVMFKKQVQKIQVNCAIKSEESNETVEMTSRSLQAIDLTKNILHIEEKAEKENAATESEQSINLNTNRGENAKDEQRQVSSMFPQIQKSSTTKY